jgi:hypothetical protein
MLSKFGLVLRAFKKSSCCKNFIKIQPTRAKMFQVERDAQ